jgi:hypothetical protein
MRVVQIVCLISGMALAPYDAVAECQPEMPASTPNTQLVDNGDSTVTDNATGLMWQQCSQGQDMGLGQNCAGAVSRYNWQSALQLPAHLNVSGGFAGYTDWRLPNVKELLSIVEEACSDPSINTQRFPNTAALNYWSSSAKASSSYSWLVDFDYGDTLDSPRYGTDNTGQRVRLVRGGH